MFDMQQSFDLKVGYNAALDSVGNFKNELPAIRRRNTEILVAFTDQWNEIASQSKFGCQSTFRIVLGEFRLRARNRFQGVHFIVFIQLFVLQLPEMPIGSGDVEHNRSIIHC